MTNDEKIAKLQAGEAEYFALLSAAAEGWEESDQKNLARFLLTPTGEKILGAIRLRHAAELQMVLGLDPSKPATPFALAVHQGICRGLDAAIVEMIEFAFPSEVKDDDQA